MKSLIGILAIFAVITTNCSSTNKPRNEIEYGEILVSENRNDPNAREISIAYVRINKTSDSKRPPIVFLQGGPGGSSLSMQNFFANSPLRKNHDIILFDARGTGQSGAFCKNAGNRFMDLMAQDLTIQEEYQGTLKICEECKEELEKNKVDVSGYNSLENAADIEALRKHLGIAKWILLGGSYGTRLGLTYLREFEAAEAAILMGLFPPEINIYEGFLDGLNSTLNYLFESCANDSDCSTRYPALQDSFNSMIKRLRQQPKIVDYRGEHFFINAQDALLLIHQMLYGRSSIQQIPAFIEALNSEGQNGILTQSIQSTAARLAVINAATYWSVQANEEVQFNEPNSIEKNLVDFPNLQPGPAFFATDQRILEQWHSFRSEPLENERIIVDTPILIANGLFDPITPIENARLVMEYLPNATLVEFPNDGHSTFNSCFFEIVDDFVSGNYKSPRASCAERGSLNWR